MRFSLFLGLTFAAFLIGGHARAQQGDGTNVGWAVHVFRAALFAHGL
jgi:hypothetical protein